MSTKLKPCPFCGGEAQLESGPDGSSVFCTSCMAKTLRIGWHENEKAVALWNTRVEEGSGTLLDITAEVGRLKEWSADVNRQLAVLLEKKYRSGQ